MKSLNKGGDVPDREDTTSLGNVGFLLNTTDSLLEQRRDFGRRSLGLSCVGTDLLGGTRDGTSNNTSLGGRLAILVHARGTIRIKPFKKKKKNRQQMNPKTFHEALR